MGKVYCLGDLHGRLDLYKAIKEFLQPEDTVIFVGDAGDRGPDSWETIKAIYNDPQFIYLMGNHEHMFVRATNQYKTGESSYYVNAWQSCYDNGGKSTLDGWMHDPDQDIWAYRLGQLRLRHRYVNVDGIEIIVCHSGFTPKEDVMEARPIADLIWDRNHIVDAWPDDKKFQNTIIVHGHTPVELLDPKLKDAVWYCGSHKIDIDTGAVWSGKACLLDLDTFDEHYFKCLEG